MKRLIFRLSSLGDVVLSQALLETPYQGETHWVVAKEYESLIVGNPKVARVWAFDRKKDRGVGAWLRLMDRLASENFTQVIDAHSTLRTKVASVYFFWKSLLSGNRPEWRSLSKERFRRFLYVTLKSSAPKSLRPTHLSYRCARLAGGSGAERPNLTWMLNESAKASLIGIAPSSAWRSKEWTTAGYIELIKSLHSKNSNLEVGLFGTPNDQAVLELASALKKQGVTFRDFYTLRRPLNEVAKTLASAVVVVGADTGLLHLAEAVGTPVVTIYGPTRADFGFGPLEPRSKPVEPSLWCSPCSKDGSLCFRAVHRFKCLTGIQSPQVVIEVNRVLSTMKQTSSSKGQSL